MSWFRTSQAFGLALCGAALALAGCGFHPLYGKQANPEVVPELGAVKIDSIQERVGQQLRNLLYARINPLGEPAKPKYILETKVRESQQSLAIQKTEVATRASLSISANYRLRDLTTGATLYSANSRATASYDLVQSEYANLAAAQDAERRTLQEVAEDMTNRLAFYFTQDHAKPQAAPAAQPATNYPPPPFPQEAAPAYPSPPTAGAPPAYEAPGYHPPAYQPPPYQQQYQQPGYQQPPYQPAYEQPPSQQAPDQQQPPPATQAPPASSGYQPNQEPDYGTGGPSPLPP